MGRMVLAWLAVATTVAACGTGQAQPGSPGGAGVTGVVVAAPGCPVHQEPIAGQSTSAQQDGCREKPVQADVRVRDVRSGRDIDTVRSSPDGRFRVPLDAGQYELQVLDPMNGSTVGPPQVVSVTPDTITETTLTFDTGIR